MSTIYHLRGEDGIERFTGTITPPPGGGSAGSTRVIKAVIDYTDLSVGADGDTIDLFTLPIGSAVLTWWVDPDTFVLWDSENENADGWLGQGAGWHPPFNGTLGRIITPGSTTTDCTDGEKQTSNHRYSLAGVKATDGSPLLVTQTTDPVQVWWDTGGQPPDPATAGHSELYFLVCEPPIPTS
jgi:hypothetical protein